MSGGKLPVKVMNGNGLSQNGSITYMIAKRECAGIMILTFIKTHLEKCLYSMVYVSAIIRIVLYASDAIYSLEVHSSVNYINHNLPRWARHLVVYFTKRLLQIFGAFPLRKKIFNLRLGHSSPACMQPFEQKLALFSTARNYCQLNFSILLGQFFN